MLISHAIGLRAPDAGFARIGRALRGFRPPERLPIVDRYLFAQVARRFSAIAAIVVALLLIENLPRLLHQLDAVDRPALLLLRTLLSLLPEYLAVGIPFGLFLAVALTFRGFGLSGELDVLGAVGLSPWRMLRVPMLFGLASCLAVFLVRGYVEPWGEQHLDQLDRAVARGDYGFGLKAGIPFHPAPGITVFVSRIAARPRRLEDIVVQVPGTVMSAPYATAQLDAKRRLHLTLRNGSMIRRGRGGDQVMRFRRLETTVPLSFEPLVHKSMRERFDRLTLGGLIAERGPARPFALASAAARVALAIFCLLLALFGFNLGVPPKRSRTALGIAAGLVLIVLYIRASAMVEIALADATAAGQAGLLAAVLAMAAALHRYQSKMGLGAFEIAALRALAPLARLRRFGRRRG